MIGIAFVETYVYARVKTFIQRECIVSLESEGFGKKKTHKHYK